jgi:Tfp pilus assembly protein PilV
MNSSKLSQYPTSIRSKFGFSLIEVVLAIGIFLVTVLALVGLLGPTLQSVDEVEKTDEIASVVNTVNAFLQSSPDIAPNASKFNVIYNAISTNSDSEATIFVYRYYDNQTEPNKEIIALEVGFASGEPVDARAKVNQPAANPANFADAAGPIYRVVLTASSVTPEGLRSPSRNGDGIHTLSEAGVANYPEGYLAMEVRIYPEDPPGPSGNFNTATNLTALKDIEPLFTYNTAIVR